MRIGVISDTHIAGDSEHIPELVLDAFKHVDMIIHAGDMVNLRVIDELKSACSRIVAVAGNMDPQVVQKKYPLKQVFDVLGFKIGLMHGYGAALNLPEVLRDAFKEDDCDVIIFGHSHKPMNEYIDGILFFNPGSATDATVEDKSYGIIEIENRPQGHGLASNSQSQQINAKIIKI
jgi:uncharacterized protein